MSGAATTRGAAGPPRIALRRGRVGGLLALAALVIAVVAVVLILLGEEQRPSGVPVETSLEGLRAAAANADHPIYWAGTGPGRRFELTETKAGKFFVRYLPAGVKVADKRASFVTVATYPYPRAYSETEKSSRRKAMVHALAPGGGIAVWSRKRPSSVYLAYPDSDRLVEVFSPDGALGQRLVLAGKVAPVGDESWTMPAKHSPGRPSKPDG